MLAACKKDADTEDNKKVIKIFLLKKNKSFLFMSFFKK
jgi:hypothetical protein